jgi:ABC-2 type transport system permease protein
MRVYWTLLRRELGAYFASITGYVVIAAAAFLMGESLVNLVVAVQQVATPSPVTELYFATPFFWMIVLLSTPVITMRLFALEKFSGTYETLMTTPVRDAEVVLAKFTAALVFYLAMWLPALACIFIVRRVAGVASPLDWGLIGTTYLGVFLLGCLFLALGCFASALTRIQTLAAMLSFLFGVSLLLVAYLAGQMPALPDWQAAVLSHLALFEHMLDFTRGVVDTRTVVFYVSLSLLFLYGTLRVVESRRWK